MAMTEVLRRMGRGDVTVHSVRSTFRDWAAERTNFPSEVVEMALAHVVGNKVEAAYRRGDLFEKRRRLMAEWATYCNAPAASGRDKVTPMRAPRKEYPSRRALGSRCQGIEAPRPPGPQPGAGGNAAAEHAFGKVGPEPQFNFKAEGIGDA
jgi:hypothetical protein